MRPVSKGDAPSGHEAWKKYTDAMPILRERLGRYCCFCERFIPVALHVEHRLPKSKFDDARLEWTNLLLACGNCNSTKAAKVVTAAEVFWPDLHNTLHAFDYAHGVVKANPALQDAAEVARVQKTIELWGLDRKPGHPNLKPTDLRWQDRRDIWEKAQSMRQDLAQRDDDVTRQYIVTSARDNGGFSIWFQVFADDADMRRRLLAAFPGTAQECFDEDSGVRPDWRRITP